METGTGHHHRRQGHGPPASQETPASREETMTPHTRWNRISGRLLLLVIMAGALCCCACLIASAVEAPGQAPPGWNGSPMNDTAPAGGAPPDGMMNGTPPGGMMPGASNGSSCVLSGAFTWDGETVTEENGTYVSNTENVSALYVKNGTHGTLVNPTIETSGNTTSNDDSSFYGLNAAVLVAANSSVTVLGGSITTTGTGANGAFPTGENASISLSGTTINATGDGGHGVMATSGGLLTLEDVNITTAGANSAPLATDRGSGTVNVTNGTVFSSGRESPGMYSTGVITVNGTNVTATGSEAAVIEGSNSITLTNISLTGSAGTRDRGIMVYQSMSGDAEQGIGTFTMTGGSYTWTSSTGPAFFVTNTNATITLSDVAVSSNASELVNASAGDWGTLGSNGGTVLFSAENEILNGSIVADEASSIMTVLRNDTTLLGAIVNASLELDGTSTWNVTADSALTALVDPDGISGSAITNIVGNGFTVTYDADLEANSVLDGRTYTLANGDTLTPT